MVTTVVAMGGGQARAEDGPGTLKGYFFYRDGEIPAGLQGHCYDPAEAEVAAAVATLGVDVAVALAGKAVESLIDAVAARTQPEATALEVIVPIEGFFNEKSAPAVHGGCLLVHNGSAKDASAASLLLSLRLVSSFDGSAFRFDVFKWAFTRFLKPGSSQWFQRGGVRDFALKIEFLTPSSAGLGTRAVFVEHVFQAVDQPALAGAFAKGQRLPWFAAPQKPTLAADARAGRYAPLNVKINVVETTKPNQFALWTQELARDKKADISTLVKDAVRRSLDPAAAATEQARLAEAGGTAYAAYKTAWDEAAAHKAAKPATPAATADEAVKAKHRADLAAWQALMTVKLQNVAAKQALARSAFQAADLAWPGDLPGLAGA